jgi:predicted RNA-binding protein YlqC (UPF0109 family)
MTESRAELRRLLILLLKVIVDYPENVEVSFEDAESPPTFHVRVNPLDIGKVIGKQGRNARSIRTLISSMALRSKDYVRVHLYIPPEV